jgi:uncharacterized protein (TIGR02246 family)
VTRLLTLLGLALAACRAAPAVDAAAEADRIRTLDHQWLAAEARRDFAGMMAIYAPDAREMLPGMPAVVGRDSIEALFRAVHARFPRFVHRFVPDTIAVAASGDLAVVRGRYRFAPDSLKPDEQEVGKFVGVWQREGGLWRLAIDISNSDRPAPRAP